MEYYDDSEYPSLHDMIEVDMTANMDGLYPQMDVPVGKPCASAVSSSCGSSMNSSGATDYQFSMPNSSISSHQPAQSVHSTALALPQKVDLDSSVSNLSWLHNVNISAIQHQQQHQQQENCNPNLLVNPQTVTPVSGQQQPSSVQQQQGQQQQQPHTPVRVIEVSLPSNVQISGGNIQYVTVPSSTQQVYITTSKSTMSNGQQSRPNGYHGYLSSPNSSQPSSTVADNPFPKPPYSYSCLIAMALKNSKQGSLPVAEIYNFMTTNFPYFKTAPDGWKNSVRHNLSLNKCFEKIENPNADGSNSRKGCLWALNPAKIKKMDEEIAKWNKKDPTAIKRSMANPEILDILEKGQGAYLNPTPQHRSTHIIGQTIRNHQTASGLLHRNTTTRLITPSHLQGHHHVTIGPQHLIAERRHHQQQQQQSQHQHNQHLHHQQMQHNNGLDLQPHKLAEDAADLFGGHEDLPLDPSLSELALQNGIWDDLPSDILDIPLSQSPTSFLSSPNKIASPVTSPDALKRYNGTHLLNAAAGPSLIVPAS